MTRLLLMRHSKAEPAGAVRDSERELVPSGRKKAVDAAKKLKKKNYTVDLIITTNALRAKQTAEIVAEVLEYEGEIVEERALYNAPFSELHKFIKRLPEDKKTILIVCHEPDISFTTASLLNRDCPHEKRMTIIDGISPATILSLKDERPFKEWEERSISKVSIMETE